MIFFIINAKIKKSIANFANYIAFLAKICYHILMNMDITYAYKEWITRNDAARHMHNGYELYYFVDGDVDYTIESVVYKLRPHDLLIIKPRTYHFATVKSTSYKRFVINFEETDAPECVRKFLQECEGVYHLRDGSVLAQMFDQWRSGNLSGVETAAFVPHLLACALIILKSDKLKRLSPNSTNETLGRIVEYLDAHPEEKVTASTLSDLFFVSPSWLVHTFKQKFGVPLMHYVNKKRLLYAQELIHSGTAPTEAARRCGFADYSTFYRQYKQLLGKSPKADK